MKLHKVLIPLDDSEFSLGVLPYVTNLLEPERNELYLFHVASKPDSISVNDEIVIYADQEAESLKAKNREKIDPLIRSLEERGYHVSPEVSFGDPASQIERFVEENDIDLVAMATHGRQGLSRLLRGSVAQHVVNHLHVPVLLLRGEADDWFDVDLGE